MRFLAISLFMTMICSSWAKVRSIIRLQEVEVSAEVVNLDLDWKVKKGLPILAFTGCTLKINESTGQEELDADFKKMYGSNKFMKIKFDEPIKKNWDGYDQLIAHRRMFGLGVVGALTTKGRVVLREYTEWGSNNSRGRDKKDMIYQPDEIVGTSDVLGVDEVHVDYTGTLKDMRSGVGFGDGFDFFPHLAFTHVTFDIDSIEAGKYETQPVPQWAREYLEKHSKNYCLKFSSPEVNGYSSVYDDLKKYRALFGMGVSEKAEVKGTFLVLRKHLRNGKQVITVEGHLDEVTGSENVVSEFNSTFNSTKRSILRLKRTAVS